MRPIPDWVSDYVGVPYLSGGRTRAGLDCWGLFTLIQRERFGRELAEYDGPLWTRGGDAKALQDAAEAFAARFQSMAPGQERDGDAILLRMLGAPVHIGCVILPGVMVHIEEGAMSCIEDYRGSAWRRRIAGFYRGWA